MVSSYGDFRLNCRMSNINVRNVQIYKGEMVISMNKIAKILSVVLSATLALSVAVVMLVSALAADAPTLSLVVKDETDSTVTLAVKLDKGGFNALDLTVKPVGENIGKCTSAKENMDFLMFLMIDAKAVDGGTGTSTAYAETGKFSTATTVAYAKEGTTIIEYTFDKNTADKVTKDDFSFTITNCVIDETQVSAKAENKLPAAEKPVDPTTEKPTDATTEKPTELPEEPTKAPEEPTKAPEEPTKAPEEPTVAPEEPTKAPEEPTAAPEEPTAAPEEPTAAPEAPTAAPEVPTAAPEEPTQAPAEETTSEVIATDGDVVNPSTGDSFTAAAAIVSLFAVSAAAVVALRKKED